MIDLGEELRGNSAIVAPCVCRMSPGSHTTIVIAVGGGRVRHVPMDSEGLRLVVSRYDAFLEEYVRTAYSPIEAAKKYLASRHIPCDPLARAALEQIIDPHKENDMNEATVETSKPAHASESAKKRNAKAQAIADSAAKHKAASDAKKAAKKTAKADKPKTAKADKPKTAKTNGSGRGLGIGAFCKEQILAGVEAEKIVEAAQRKFPGCRVNGAHISWYRGKLREEGKLK